MRLPARTGVRSATMMLSPVRSPRCQDISLAAVFVMQTGDTGRAVWIVFQGHDDGRHVEFGLFEIYVPVQALDPAATMHGSYAALVVAADGAMATARQRLQRRHLGQVAEVIAVHVSPRGRCRFITFHGLWLGLGDGLAVLQGHDSTAF